MSIISTRHNINPFVSGKSEALTGQRLSRIGYKSTKNNPAKYPSVCVSVPHINPADITANINSLMPYIGNMLETAQDGIIRSLFESSHGTKQSISDEDISILACIGYLESESNGGRLTKEYLELWFDSNIAENLSVVIADKLGFDMSTEAQMETITKHLNGYKGLIASLSGGKTILQPNQISACKRALEIASIDDDTSAKLTARLNNMVPKKMEELLEV